jgi:excisionase family DNA binding protein
MPARLETLFPDRVTGLGITSGPEPLMTASQVAERLGVPKSWVYEKSALGVIPSIKVGVYRRFRWSQIEAWLEEVNT